MSKKNRRYVEQKDASPIVVQREKLDGNIQIAEPNWTDKQKQLIDLVNQKHCSIVFIDGCAGTSKTFTSVYCGLRLLAEKKVSDFLYIRSVIESASKSLGFLPGESEDKFRPFTIPLDDKLNEFLEKHDIDRLYKDKRIKPLPYNYLRGCNWNVKFILADEAQNATFQELTTLITRIGKFSKLLVIGDTGQSDLNGKSGFKKMYEIFNNDKSRQNGIYCFRFGKEDIMRSGVVRYIIETLEGVK